MKQNRIKFKRIKLGRQKVWGNTDEYPLQIEDRLKGKKELEIYVHESLHYLWPECDEDEIERKANLFRRLLVHPAILSITGKGLMMGLTFSSEQFAKDVIQACIENGVLTDWFLFAPHKLRLAPPLVINDSEITTACERILKSIDQVLN